MPSQTAAFNPNISDPTLVPDAPFEIRPHDNWDALFDLPPESWDLFNLDNEGMLNFDDPNMAFGMG